MTQSETQRISQRVVKKIHDYEHKQRVDRKIITMCALPTATLLCAFTAITLVAQFAPALPPTTSAAQSVLEQSGAQMNERVICDGVTFTVEGVVWDDTVCHLWLSADAHDLTMGEFSFVVQPWSESLVPDPSSTQNCAVTFLTQEKTGRAQMMLSYLFAPQDTTKSILNLAVRSKSGETGHVALPVALAAPRAQSVVEIAPVMLPSTPPVSNKSKEVALEPFCVTSVTVHPFGAVLAGTGSVQGLFAAEKLSFTVSTSAGMVLPAQAVAQYANGVPRILLLFSATVSSQDVAKIVCDDTVVYAADARE